MKKARLSVYLDQQLSKELADYAAHRRASLSLVAEAAIASFLSPDSAERQEAVLARRLDRISRQIERLERDTGIGVETLALFVRFWLTTTPQLPETQQDAAQAKGRERYQRFVEALGGRLAQGKTLTKEVSEDLPGKTDA